MPIKIVLPQLLIAIFFASLLTPARAQEEFYVNGLPCPSFCQQWMGIVPGAPPRENSQEADRRAARPANLKRQASIASFLAKRAHSRQTEEERTSHRQRREEAVRLPEIASAGAGLSPVSRSAAVIDTKSVHATEPGPANPGESALAQEGSPNESARAGIATRLREQNSGSPAVGNLASQLPDVLPSIAAEDPSNLSVTPPMGGERPATGISGDAPANDARAGESAGSQVTSAASVAGKKIEAQSDRETQAGQELPPQISLRGSASHEVKSTRAGGESDKPNAVALATIPEPTVLVVIAAPDIEKISDLENKPVEIAGVDKLSAETANAALAAAGASAVKISVGGKNDVDRLVAGEVSAVIVAFLTPVKASKFPEITGYKLLLLSIDNKHG